MITRKEFEEALDRLIEDSKNPRYIPWYMKLSEKEFMEYMNLLEEESKKYMTENNMEKKDFIKCLLKCGFEEMHKRFIAYDRFVKKDVFLNLPPSGRTHNIIVDVTQEESRLHIIIYEKEYIETPDYYDASVLFQGFINSMSDFVFLCTQKLFGGSGQTEEDIFRGLGFNYLHTLGAGMMITYYA